MCVGLQMLMDPVCCLTCYPQLLDSFVYKEMTLYEAFGSLDGLANAVRIIFSRDLIIAEVPALKCLNGHDNADRNNYSIMHCRFQCKVKGISSLKTQQL